MRKDFINSVLLFLLSNITLYSQFLTYSYSGIIRIQDSIIIPYEINVSKIGQKLTGYSISDKGGINETKSSLIILKKNDSLFITENEIVYTKADYSTFDDFCLVSFKIKEKTFLNKKNFKLDFKGKFSDGISCLNGQINLFSLENLNKKLKKIEKKVTNSKILKKKYKDSLQIISEKFNDLKNYINQTDSETELKNNNTIVFSFKADYRIYIKDFKIMDGDEINLIINNRKKLIAINKNKYYFNLIDSLKTNEITIEGVSEGEISPITAEIGIENFRGKLIKTIKLNIEKDQSSFIKLVNTFNN